MVVGGDKAAVLSARFRLADGAAEMGLTVRLVAVRFHSLASVVGLFAEAQAVESKRKFSKIA